MTEAMVSALARLYKEGVQKHGWANALASADGQRGFGFHRMAVATGCPCDVRLNMRREILNRAFSVAPTPPPTPPPDFSWGDDMIIRNAGIVRQLIYSGEATYWRTLPANAVSRIPANQIIDDDGSLLALWRTTPLN